MADQEGNPTPKMAVRELLTDPLAEFLALEVLAGEDGLKNTLSNERIQKPGLALAGFLEYIHPGRIQILGKSEITFLKEKPKAERSRLFRQVCRQGVACFVITSGLEVFPEITDAGDDHQIPILRTELRSSETIDGLGRYLGERLAPRAVIHGVLVDVYGLGVLLLGDSGIGKSECALDLVVRGHRLVSDDVVEIKRRGDVLIGSGPELTRYHMELRGLGIVNVKDLFGVASVRQSKFVEFVLKLDAWNTDKDYDRLGLDDNAYEVLGIELPFVEMPVGPGRNLAVLIEVAARNYLLKLKGFHPARQLARRLEETLKRNSEDNENSQLDDFEERREVHEEEGL